MKENIIAEKSYKFAIRIINLYKYLRTNKREYEIARQVLRSGTSIGANIEEAIGGFSKRDFTAKVNIAYKEARETKYWLRLLFDTHFIDFKMFDSISNDCNELLKIIGSILKTLKTNS